MGFTWSYWVLLSFNAVYWVLKWVTLGFSGFYWVLLSFNSVALSFVPTMTNQSVFFCSFQENVFSFFLLKKSKIESIFFLLRIDWPLGRRSSPVWELFYF